MHGIDMHHISGLVLYLSGQIGTVNRSDIYHPGLVGIAKIKSRMHGAP